MENKYVTKKYLNETVEEFAKIVNDGFSEQAKLFCSELKQEISGVRTELKQEIKKSEKNVLNKVDQRVGEVEQTVEKLEKKVEESEKKILGSNEKITTELKTVRQEQVMNVGAHSRMQDSIDSHNFRIKKLELQAV